MTPGFYPDPSRAPQVRILPEALAHQLHARTRRTGACPLGRMDKAPPYEGGDSRFESWRGRCGRVDHWLSYQVVILAHAGSIPAGHPADEAQVVARLPSKQEVAGSS